MDGPAWVLVARPLRGNGCGLALLRGEAAPTLEVALFQAFQAFQVFQAFQEEKQQHAWLMLSHGYE